MHICSGISEQELLDELLNKIKSKSVYKTLKRIASGKTTDKWKCLKGLYSLSTHICIECERDDVKFKPLLNIIYSKIGELLLQES